MKRLNLIIAGIGLTASPYVFAQGPVNYGGGTNVTGQLSYVGSVNLLQQSQLFLTSFSAQGKPDNKIRRSRRYGSPPSGLSTQDAIVGPSLTVNTSPGIFGINGLSHFDQHNANNGTQYSTEPATPAIAVGNGIVIEVVDDAVQVYGPSGNALLATPVATNQIFGLIPEIDDFGVNGPFLTDARAFYDQGTGRFFVAQWAQGNDPDGNPLNSSTMWVAVSQGTDPTQGWNIYSMNTTDSANFFRCPCVPDYPQLGADQNGLYISSNEFRTSNGQNANNITILAINKTALTSGVATPTMVRYLISNTSGYEFSVQPAVTPAGGSYFTAQGGIEYFVSTISNVFSSSASTMAIWAMTNTASLAGTPNLTLTEIYLPTQMYSYPPSAAQKAGILPLGEIPGYLAPVDGGDIRTLSNVYVGGRLYVSMSTQVNGLVGGAYFIISPVVRNGALTAQMVRQGYISVANNNLLRPVVAVNSAGKGAIVATLVGPDYYPSAAFVKINTTTTDSVLQVPGMGQAPEDGFTCYEDQFGDLVRNICRWGDSSAAWVNADGSIWMVTGFIPGGARSTYANWGTYLMHYTPNY